MKIVGQIFREHLFTIICFAVFHRLLFAGGLRLLYSLPLGNVGELWHLWAQPVSFWWGVGLCLSVALFCLYVSFFVLWEVAAYLLLYQQCYGSRVAAFGAMVIVGAKRALGICQLKNYYLLCLYLLLILPFQAVIVWSGLYLSVQIPYFILQFLGQRPLLLVVINLLLMGIQLLGMVGLFFFHFLFLRRKSIKTAWKASRHMGLWRLGQTALLLGLWGLLWSLGSFLLYVGVGIAAYFLPSTEMALVLVDGIGRALLLFQGLLFAPVSIAVVHGCYLIFIQGEMDTACPYVMLRGGRLLFTCFLGLVMVVSCWYVIAYGGYAGRVLEERPVLIAAHRGDSEGALENTLAAIARAKGIGVGCIEIDVQMTKDGRIVLFHDRDVRWGLGTSKTVGQLTYADLQMLTDEKYSSVAGEERPFPLLEDALAAGGPGMKWNIEIKTYPPGTVWAECRWNMAAPLRFLGKGGMEMVAEVYSQEEQAVAAVISLLEEAHLQDQVVISSLDYEVLQLVKEENPDFETLYILPFVGRHMANLSAADGYSIEISALSPSVYREIRNTGKRLWVWTVNDGIALGKLFSYQVDGVITDRPQLLEKILCSRNNDDRQQFFRQFLFSWF